MKVLMTGNEAAARGAYEAGVHIATGYPGTPSTEILENLGTYDEVRSDWAPNEKVALEEACGASIAGARAFVTCKHVGMNVMADPLFTMAYEGVNGGLVILTADEPGMHSSQNEQDNRIYASHAKVMLLEPSNSQEVKDFIKQGFELSEKFDTVVIVRLTTRVCHSKSPVELEDRVEVPIKKYEKNISKYIMLPAYSRPKHIEMEEVRIPAMRAEANISKLNRIEYNDKKIGIIANGMAYNHAVEVFGDTASYLKMGFTYPMPDDLIREFAKNVEEIYIIEENEPYMEQYIKAMGIKCKGKEIVPICGEITPEILRHVFFNEPIKEHTVVETALPPRPPALCAGCPHRGVFQEMKKYKTKIMTTTDIGCYTLGASDPTNVGDVCICMGAGFTAGIGFARAKEIEGNKDQRVFGIMGDSTFFHSGMTGLVDMVYSDANMVAVILDNSTTAMTGHQNNPGNGKNLKGEVAEKVSIRKIVEAMGFVEGKNFKIIDAYNLDQVKEIVKEAYEAEGPFVIIVERECALLKEVQKKRAKRKCYVTPEKCIGCKRCVQLGCPAVQYFECTDGSSSKGKMVVDKTQCIACTMCLQVCPANAISVVMED